MITTTAKKYAQIKLKINTLTQEMRELEEDLINNLLNEGKNVIELNSGRISLVHRKQWSYSPTVDSLASKLKERKQIEEIKGIATYEEKLGLMFKEN